MTYTDALFWAKRLASRQQRTVFLLRNHPGNWSFGISRPRMSRWKRVHFRPVAA